MASSISQPVFINLKGKDMNIHKRALRGNLASRRQAGMTLIELMIVLVIITVLVAGAVLGWNEYNRQRGANEGKVIAAALTCAQGQISAPTFAGVTLANLVNKECFPRELVTATGATGSATSQLSGSAYTVGVMNIQSGTSNGIAITVGPISSRNCNGLVTELNHVAAGIEVTAAALTTNTVAAAGAAAPKVPGSNLNDGNAGLGCKGSDPVYVRGTVGRT